MLHLLLRGASFAVLLTLSVLVTPCGAAEPPAAIMQVIAARHLPPGSVSFVVMDAADGRVLASLDPDTPRSPASTLKVVTTYAALDLLGPAYTWHTRALIRGRLREGVLDGDLILQGGGDPYMSLERWWGFARALRRQGLRVIHGDIVIDDSAFTVPPEDPAAFDGRPNRLYNALPNALLVNFQAINLRIAPDAASQRVLITVEPEPANLTIENHIQFVPGRCSAAADRVNFEVEGKAWDHVVFSGRLAGECAPREVGRLLLQAPTYAFGTFVNLWRQLGGEFDGHLRVAGTPADATALASYDSLSLGEVIRLTNKHSNNVMARHLLLSIGAERFGRPGTVENGKRAIAEWSRARGLGLEDVDMDNGSGLSRVTRISALRLAGVLRSAWHDRYAPELLASLPLAGIDGTLRTRMQDTPPGAVRLKTGHLEGVNAVAGYVTPADGRTCVVVALINDPHADNGGGEPVHAALVRWVLENL